MNKVISNTMEHTSSTFNVTVVCDKGVINPKLQIKRISLELYIDDVIQEGTKIPLLQLLLTNYNTYSATKTTEVNTGSFETERCNVNPKFWTKLNKTALNKLNKLFNKGRVEYFIVNDEVLGLYLAVDYYQKDCEHHYNYKLTRQGV